MRNSRDVLALFRDDPFGGKPPKMIRAVLWQYWFTSIEGKRQTGNWWRRQFLGLYAPVLSQQPDGKIAIVEVPQELPSHE